MLAERKARREHDDALLAFVERHSRFFALVTLVTGALTGVGIWFTIGLINPSATASLIASFVWGWAIEWTFFVTEIAAAIVYVYGWHRLSPAVHLRVGWVYFIAAWLSLAVINGILTFMLTPGASSLDPRLLGGHPRPERTAVARDADGGRSGARRRLRAAHGFVDGHSRASARASHAMPRRAGCCRAPS